MEAVTVKFQEDVLKRVDEAIEGHNFNSRTEFIREAVRNKLTDLSKEELMTKFLKFRGKAKHKTNYQENLKTKEIISKELISELDKRFN